MALNKQQVDELFLAYRDRKANGNEFEKFKNASYEDVAGQLAKPWAGQESFVKELFKKYRGREATDKEVALYKQARPDFIISDLVNDADNTQLDPFKDFQSFEDYEKEQRPLIEQEYGPYYDELIAGVEKDVNQRMQWYGEDKATALQRALEDKDDILSDLANKEKYLQEDVETGKRRLDRQGRLLSEDLQTTMEDINRQKTYAGEDVGTARERLGQQQGYLAEDKQRDLSAQGRQFGEERRQQEQGLNQQGLLVGSAFDQGGVAGNIRERGETDRTARLQNLQTQYGRQETNLGQQGQDIEKQYGRQIQEFTTQEQGAQRGYRRGKENLSYNREDLERGYNRGVDDIHNQQGDVERGYGRGVEDIGKDFNRNTYSLTDYVDKKKKDIEQQKQGAIAEGVYNRYATQAQ